MFVRSDIKMKFMCIILPIILPTVLLQEETVSMKEQTHENGFTLLDKNSQSVDSNSSSDTSISTSVGRENDVKSYAVSERSRTSHKSEKAGKLRAKGKLRSRGIGRYGKVSSEGTYFTIAGKFRKYGQKIPTKSKFKTHGKEKKYSKKIVDNRFDIKSKLIEKRRHRKTGGYEAYGKHVRLSLQDSANTNNSLQSRNSESGKLEATGEDKSQEFQNTVNEGKWLQA
ncbi:unnamed protein product [Heterobilharzia americana]|nr:unnamed protein product [Heterobilharzia americana]